MHIKATGGVFTDDDIKKMLARINAESAKATEREVYIPTSKPKPRSWLTEYGLLLGMSLLLLGQVLATVLA